MKGREAPGTENVPGASRNVCKILPYINSNNPDMPIMTVFYKKFIIYDIKYLFRGNREYLEICCRLARFLYVPGRRMNATLSVGEKD